MADPTKLNRTEIFVVERENGEWIDASDSGGYSCFLSLEEAQYALEAEADVGDDDAFYKIIRFVREEESNG